MRLTTLILLVVGCTPLWAETAQPNVLFIAIDDLNDLEDDPLEWTNLLQTRPEESRAVIAKLSPFLPQSDAEEIPKSSKDKSVKKIDESIKPRRDLSQLK